jgi:hypothetical protein
MNADIAARVRILDDYDDALARFFVLFLSKKKSAFRFVSNSARGKYLASSSFPISLSDFSKISLSSLSLSLSLYAL